MPDLVLASGSPRRALLLESAGYVFRIDVPHVDETQLPGEEPAEMVLRLSAIKANAIERSTDEIVLAADTIVVLDGAVLGKPVDRNDARRMLRQLSGRSHVVYTGWTVCHRDGERFGVADSTVTFHELSDEAIASYVDDVDPLDKAGAYAIQGDGGRLIRTVTGSRANVMGLPLGDIATELTGLGVRRAGI